MESLALARGGKAEAEGALRLTRYKKFGCSQTLELLECYRERQLMKL